MIIKEQIFRPVIVGGDIGSYSIARAFHEEYAVKSIVLSKIKYGPSTNSKIIDNIIEENLDDDKVFNKRLIEIARAKIRN